MTNINDYLDLYIESFLKKKKKKFMNYFNTKKKLVYSLLLSI